ncbi:MAG: hypothetical protein ACLGI6_22480 [Gammaproteobacteria bacterium]
MFAHALGPSRLAALALSALLPLCATAGTLDAYAVEHAPLPTRLDAAVQLDAFTLLLPKLQQITTACAVPRATLSISHDKLQRAPCYLA